MLNFSGILFAIGVAIAVVGVILTSTTILACGVVVTGFSAAIAVVAHYYVNKP